MSKLSSILCRIVLLVINEVELCTASTENYLTFTSERKLLGLQPSNGKSSYTKSSKGFPSSNEKIN